MSFQAGGVLVALLFQSAELSSPVDCPASHGRPFLAAPGWFLLNVFAVNMADSILRQLVISIWKRVLPTHRRVAWIPVDHDVRGLDSRQSPCRFRARCGVARVFVFQIKNDVLLGGFVRGFSLLVVNGSAVRGLLVQPPEIQNAN